MLTDIVKKIKSASKEPGIYIFYRNRTPLYVGKASNLKNRLQNYLAITDLKTESLHREANKLKVIKLRTNIEALIVESQYIKKLRPRYNILWRDDSSYTYVFITKDVFPRIFIGHETDKKRFYPDSQSIGPFTDTAALKTVFRLLRKYFPYCNCVPHLRICLNAQINNCPGYCCKKQHIPTKKEKFAYRKNISAIISILTGKNKTFIKKLKDPYQLLILDKIWQHAPYLANSEWRIANSGLPIADRKNTISHKLSAISRAECYDNSHLSGKEAVGAMTAWKKENGIWIADKNMWRKFKIYGNYTEDDPRMMHEIVSRRLRHPEWQYPDLIIIDGGIAQFNAALSAVNKLKVEGLKLKVISFAKPDQKIFGLEKSPILITKLPPEFQKLIKQAIQNTHNFVIRYHRKIRRRMFLK